MGRENNAARLNQRLNSGQIKRAGGIEDLQNSDQHQNRAKHCVQNEFYGGVYFAIVPPNSDQEIHRNQHHFPENEKQEKIQRNKYADYAGFENQQANEE